MSKNTYTPDGTTPVREYKVGDPYDTVSIDIDIEQGPDADSLQRVDIPLIQNQNIDLVICGEYTTAVGSALKVKIPNSTPHQYCGHIIIQNIDDTDTVHISWWDAYERDTTDYIRTYLAPGQFCIIPNFWTDIDTSSPVSILASANTPKVRILATRMA